MPDSDWREKMIARERRQLRAAHQRGQVGGTFAAIFACAMLGYSLYRGGPQGEGAFYLGQLAGWVVGIVLLVVGLYYVFRKPNKPTLSPQPVDMKDSESLESVRHRPEPPGTPQVFLRTFVKPWTWFVAAGFLVGGAGAFGSIEIGGPAFIAMIVVGIASLTLGLVMKKLAKP